jgi:hypothetical protein
MKDLITMNHVFFQIKACLSLCSIDPMLKLIIDSYIDLNQHPSNT